MDNTQELVELTAEVVSSYIANNSIPAASLPELIGSVYATLSGLGGPVVEPVTVVTPAVSIRKSVTPDYLISLFDGKRYKSLKRHLNTSHGMTPADYRAHFGLPSDYPMVAPAYAAKRSELAKTMGLGRKSNARKAEEAAAAEAAKKTARKPRAKKAAAPPADGPAED